MRISTAIVTRNVVVLSVSLLLTKPGALVVLGR